MGSVQPVATGFFPLDDELALLPGGLTPLLHEQLVRLGAWMPFGQAAKLLVEFMRLTSVSEPTARRQTETAGAALVACQTEAVERLAGPDSPPPVPMTAQLCLSVDGAMVPLRQGEWAEAKTLVIGEVTPAAPPADREAEMTHLSYFSRLTDNHTFEHLALVETQRRGLTEAQAVAAVGDGAEWVQGFVDYHRPDAVRILDFPHAAGYLSQMGQAVYGEGTPESQAWLTLYLHRLKHEGPREVLAELRTLTQAHPDRPELADHLAYLEKREAQMQYPAFQAAGWPIGSGAVESANKLVVEARLKGSGMRWARAQVDPMLALRNAVCNDRWAEAWAQLAPRLRQRRRARPTPAVSEPLPFPETVTEDPALRSEPEPPRGELPLPASRPSKLPQPQAQPTHAPRRPAANHPWRRMPVGKALYQPAASPN